MNLITTTQTEMLLQEIKKFSVQVFHHFPEIILVGNKSINKEDFTFLQGEKYIREVKNDSFGKIYGLSRKGESLLADGAFIPDGLKISQEAQFAD